MDWVDWKKFRKPKGCCCWEAQNITCNVCGNAHIRFAVRQTIKHCAKIAGSHPKVADHIRKLKRA